MLRTVLLLDGSEAMNSSSDYLPSYLLAMRSPLLTFVRQYLDSTPLASLGVVVMRNGVGERLCACTTSASAVVDVLERDYLLYGGSGAASLENGLRMTLSELVDLKKVEKQRAARSGGGKADPSSSASASVVKARVVLLSASVTMIDPTDVFAIIAAMVNFSIEVDVISFAGSVHVFEEVARQTGGRLHAPLNYDHLLQIIRQLAVGTASSSGGAASRKRLRRRRSRRTAGSPASDSGVSYGSDAQEQQMVPIGFPVYIERTQGDETTTTSYLACPQCHLLQKAVPTTCSLCRLLICNVAMMLSTFVRHNNLIPASTEMTIGEEKKKGNNNNNNNNNSNNGSSSNGNVAQDSTAASARCDMCTDVITSEGSVVRQCTGCAAWRCAPCHQFVTETMGVCPQCIALL